MNSELQNGLKALLINQYEKYPLMQASDMLKLIYQNEFGCGHMVTDSAGCLRMIIEEAQASAGNTPGGQCIEDIGGGLCRLRLDVLRQTTLAPETLCSFFMQTANSHIGSAEGFEEKAAVLLSLCEGGVLPFDAREISRLLAESRANGHPPVRHSEQYRAEYSPAYRVVSKAFCDFLPLFCAVDGLVCEKQRATAAIDGNSAAGKSSLAKLLKSVYDCNVFSMDDFFLQPFQRTPRRLEQPGGNVDYERFAEEVAKPLASGIPPRFRVYDCQTQRLSEFIEAAPTAINIVEGVYSLRPELIGAYDLKVFLSVGEDEQSRRIKKRNPFLYERFKSEWLPMERKYFEAFAIREKCDIIFDT
ncbi:MAG: hypothetical protein FWH02_02825 [Oscillospiraceae bacterium]|nr:hypothetical protein [Oscillospiraceae bacterium]